MSNETRSPASFGAQETIPDYSIHGLKLTQHAKELLMQEENEGARIEFAKRTYEANKEQIEKAILARKTAK
ncbi:MAG: hypothetical protein IK101_01920 [Oscillospiraceae bacterium]|nr:hypothetical protein [Oscillospiraceae bacterium]